MVAWETPPGVGEQCTTCEYMSMYEYLAGRAAKQSLGDIQKHIHSLQARNCLCLYVQKQPRLHTRFCPYSLITGTPAHRSS